MVRRYLLLYCKLLWRGRVPRLILLLLSLLCNCLKWIRGNLTLNCQMKRLKKRNSKKKSGATPLLLRSLVTAVTDSADDSSGVGSLVTTRVLKVVFSDDWKSKKNELDKATNYKQYDVWGDMNLYDLDKAMWGDMNLWFR